MSITDELREWAEEFWEFAYGKFDDKSDLISIADRIDSALADGYVWLPKDINGITIHIGDVIDCGESTFKVNELRLTKAGWNVGDCRHHKPTVEELLEEMYDALDDARIPNGSEKRTYEEIIAEYAQMLQLREETE